MFELRSETGLRTIFARHPIHQFLRAVPSGACVILVGEGENRARIEEHLARSGMAARVILAGYRADFFDFIESADLFVHPALRPLNPGLAQPATSPNSSVCCPTGIPVSVAPLSSQTAVPTRRHFAPPLMASCGLIVTCKEPFGPIV